MINKFIFFAFVSAIAFLANSCMLVPPPPTICTVCERYTLPENAVEVAQIYVSATKRADDSLFVGKTTLSLQAERTYILHFKQCPNVKLYDISVDISDNSDKRSIIQITHLECINAREAYVLFSVPQTKPYTVTVHSKQKLGVRLKLGVLKKM